MSRSNPTENQPHPCKRWFEWDGSNGTVRYYDKEQQQNIDVGDDITFILLDRLATVKGWHDRSDSGIYSNEVKDTRQDVLVVKAFKGGVIAEGVYAQIKDRVGNAGGYFTTNCYIAFKEDGHLMLGSIMFKGAALGVWMDFEKANRSEIYKKAIRIKGSTEGKKGKIEFKTPKFFIRDLDENTDAAATSLDQQELQPYLKAYFSRTKVEQLDQTSKHAPEDENQDTTDYGEREKAIAPRERQRPPIDPDLDPADDDIPF